MDANPDAYQASQYRLIGTVPDELLSVGYTIGLRQDLIVFSSYSGLFPDRV
jgi:hypothetical protein